MDLQIYVEEVKITFSIRNSCDVSEITLCSCLTYAADGADVRMGVQKLVSEHAECLNVQDYFISGWKGVCVGCKELYKKKETLKLDQNIMQDPKYFGHDHITIFMIRFSP